MSENHVDQGNDRLKIINYYPEALGMTHACLVQLTQLAHSGGFHTQVTGSTHRVSIRPLERSV